MHRSAQAEHDRTPPWRVSLDESEAGRRVTARGYTAVYDVDIREWPLLKDRDGEVTPAEDRKSFASVNAGPVSGLSSILLRACQIGQGPRLSRRGASRPDWKSMLLPCNAVPDPAHSHPRPRGRPGKS